MYIDKRDNKEVEILGSVGRGNGIIVKYQDGTCETFSLLKFAKTFKLIKGGK